MQQVRRSRSAVVKHWIGCLLTAAMANGANAQYEAPPLSLWNSVEVYTGTLSLNTPFLDRQDLGSLLAGSQWSSPLLLSDLSFRSSSGVMDEEEALFGISIGLLPLRRDDRPGPELRLGILHASRSTRVGFYEKTSRTPHDTLISIGTGEEYQLDSVVHEAYRVAHGGERLGLAASLTWQGRGRWRFYGGIGVQGGLRMNVTTEVEHTRTVRLEEHGHGWPVADLAPRLREQEILSPRDGAGWWLGGYLPLGLDFQVSRKNNFWSQVRLFMEYRPQVVVMGNSSLASRAGSGIQGSFGLRINLQPQAPKLDGRPD
ncbi:MAG TPA: hypothetical protein PKD45_09585 [Flavobacteriales bacterium]|nr:hypothetical protein [Flavobacteriales bacterium]